MRKKIAMGLIPCYSVSFLLPAQHANPFLHFSHQHPAYSTARRFFIAVLIVITIVTETLSQVKPVAEALPAAQTVATKPAAYAAGMPLNYVRTWVPLRPLTTEAEVIAASRTVKEVSRSTAYSDGLGRQLQLVNWQAAPANSASQSFDVVSPSVYDESGREKYRYLPYTAKTGNGAFKAAAFAEQDTFMLAQYPGEQVFYGQMNYEASPLSRVLNTLAPGNSWAGSSRGIQTAYEINGANEVRSWSVTFTAGAVPVSAGYYAAGVLYRTVTSDEHGRRMVEYKDKYGKVVLTKAEVTAGAAVTGFTGWLHTYYVYDDLQRLRYVIQPKGVEQLSTGWVFDAATWAGSNIARELCFSYEYDSRGLMVIKRVPGAGEVQLVYDGRDRLVMTQDARMRTTQQWLVTQYDDWNRPVKTYFWISASARDVHAAAAAGSSNYPGIATPADGYLTVTFYDNYNWVSTSGSGLTGSFAASETTTGFMAASDITFPYPRSVSASAALKGLVTGTQVRVLGTAQYLYNIHFYDDRHRLVQTKSVNVSGYTDIVTTQYSFDGKALVTKNSHNASGTTPATVKVLTQRAYDHAGRLLSVKKQLNGGAWVTIDSLLYDAGGQLAAKQLGRQKPGGVYSSLPLETLTYSYNIRGWLTGINKEYVANPGANSNFFGEALSYNYGVTQKQYNGNVAGVTWCSRNDQQVRGYGYTYDAGNRLLKADFTEKINASTWNTTLGRDYTAIMGNGADAALAYDANGNILRMQQFITPSTKMDDLTYNYDWSVSGNRLKRVTDANNNSGSTLGDFKEITSGQTQDYDYDSNGNIVYDLNKGISSITYNHLNLPSLITITGKGTIAYTYDASGNKIKKTVTDATSNNAITTTTYIGSFQYENNDLKQLGHEEGRIRRKPDGSYVYDYFVRDHLGNVRATLTEEETVAVYAVATMEQDSAAKEEAYYANLAETRAVKPAAYPDTSAANKYVAMLDGRQKKAGPSLLLKVSAGDKINIQAKSWYQHNGKRQQDVLPFAGAFSNVLGNTAGTALLHQGPVLQHAAGAAVVPGVMSFLQTRDRTDEKISRKPKAYLNWVLLDEDLKPFKQDTVAAWLKQPEYAGFQRVGEEGLLTQHIKEGWEIEKSGYVYVFTSSESADADVVFEELGVTFMQGPLLEVDHYYPFGLAIAGISSKAEGRLHNKYKYNSKELQTKEFSDGSGLELYDYGARMYDHQIGRYHTQDRFSIEFTGFTPYHYAANDPVKYVDVNGDYINVRNFLRGEDGKVNMEGAYMLFNILADLQEETGLDISVNADMNLQIVGENKEGEAFSQAARDFTKGIINDKKNDIILHSFSSTDMVEAGYTKKNGKDMYLDASQIEDRIQSTRKAGLGDKTWGFGFWFLHEAHHTWSGTKYYDKKAKETMEDYLPPGPNGEDMTVRPGPIETKINAMRSQLGMATRKGYAWYPVPGGSQIEWQTADGKSVQLRHQTMPEAEKKARREAVQALPNYNNLLK